MGSKSHETRTSVVCGSLPKDKPDLRREVRYAPQRLVDILPCRARNEWNFKPAELIDCSTSGVGLIVDEPLQTGEQFIMKIKLVKWVLLLYTVRYCVPVEGRGSAQRAGQMRIGAELCGYVDATRHHDPEAVLAALIAEVRNESN
jgi:hypothetical protein